MAYSLPKVTAFIQQVADYAQTGDGKALLESNGMDPVAFAADLESGLAAITARNTEQENLKDALNDKSKEVESALDDGYTKTSSKVDVLIGLAGKRSPIASTLTEMRKKAQ